MEDKILHKIGKKDKRVSVNITLKESTLKRLTDYKDKNKIDYLSPMIDDMLNVFFDELEEIKVTGKLKHRGEIKES